MFDETIRLRFNIKKLKINIDFFFVCIYARLWVVASVCIIIGLFVSA